MICSGEVFPDMYRELFGYGIFATDGEAWKKQRKVASYIFTARNLKDHMTKVFLENGAVVCEKLDMYSKNNVAFDIQDMFFR